MTEPNIAGSMHWLKLEQQLSDRHAIDAAGHRVLAAFLVACVLAPVAVLLGALHLAGVHGVLGRGLEVTECLLLLASSIIVLWRPFKKSHKAWIGSRTVSELLRRESWLHRAKVGPYVADNEGLAESRLKIFKKWLKQMGVDDEGPIRQGLDDQHPIGEAIIDDPEEEVRWIAELARIEYGSPTPAPREEANRNSWATLLREYRAARILNQKEWYEKRLIKYERQDESFHLIVVVTLCAAFVLSLARFQFEELVGISVALVWLPSLSAGVIALRSYLGIPRLKRSYALQVELLERLDDHIGQLLADPASPEFVLQTRLAVISGETTFAREYRRWLLAVEPEEPLP